MNFFNWIGGFFKSGKEIVEVFKPNAEKSAQRLHDEDMASSNYDSAVLQQFAKEFQNKANRSWWDSFVDGLNRLPRPLITFGVLSFFVFAPIYPQKFIEVAAVYEKIPSGYWALLSIIVGFYFGGRMQIKSHDMAIKDGSIKAAKDLIAIRNNLRSLEDEGSDEETRFRNAIESGAQVPENQVIRDWKEGKGSASTH